MADAVRPTQQQEQAREDFAYELLSRALLKSQIKTQFAKKFGELSPRTIERYLSRARARMIAESGKTKDEHRQEALAFYQSCLRNGEATVKEKILARERIDKLLGLDAPQKVAPTSPDGESPYDGLNDADLNRRIIEQLAARNAGNLAETIGSEPTGAPAD